MRVTVPFFAKVLAVCALIVAMAGSGFAHKVERSELSPDLAAYVAAGGLLIDICGTGGQTEAGGVKCDACRLIGAAVVPLDTGLGPVVLTAPARKMAFVAKRLRNSQGLDPARLTRAPPQA